MYDFALPAMTLETKEYCGYNKTGVEKAAPTETTYMPAAV